MKRLVFLFISILFITFAFAKTGVYAQDRVVQTDTPLGVEMPATPSSETTPRRVNYELAYPGMLPDDKKYYEESEFVEEVIEKLNQIKRGK